MIHRSTTRIETPNVAYPGINSVLAGCVKCEQTLQTVEARACCIVSSWLAHLGAEFLQPDDGAVSRRERRLLLLQRVRVHLGHARLQIVCRRVVLSGIGHQRGMNTRKEHNRRHNAKRTWIYPQILKMYTQESRPHKKQFNKIALCERRFGSLSFTFKVLCPSPSKYP